MTHVRPRRLVRTVAPAAEPVTLTETKAYLRIDTNDEDTLLTTLITVAREAAEEYLGRSLITQTWQLAFDDFVPSEVRLPRGPVQNITSVKSYTQAEAETVISTDAYYLNAAKDRVCFTSLIASHRIEILYVSGYGNAAGDVPSTIRHALLAFIARLYEVRGETIPAMPEETMALLAPFRERAI